MTFLFDSAIDAAYPILSHTDVTGKRFRCRVQGQDPKKLDSLLQVLTGLLPIFNDSAFACFSHFFLRFWSSKTFFATQVSSRRLNLPSSWALQPGDVPSCPERMLGVPTTAFLSPGWWISMDLYGSMGSLESLERRNLRSNVTVLIVLRIFENQTNGASRPFTANAEFTTWKSALRIL